MVDSLRSFADEVTRVAREVGTEGVLGGQAVGARRVRRMARAHPERELDGQQPDQPGAQHLPTWHAQSRPATCRARSRSSARRGARPQGHGQHDGRSAQRLRRRGDARRPRGRYRGPARRSGHRPGRPRHVEGLHRQRQRDGVEPDQPGPRHRGGDDCRRPRRPDAQDHRRRQGRDPRAEEHDQHHGRSAQLVRRSDHPAGDRGRHRGQARRPGRRAWRARHVAAAHRLGQLDGRTT